MRIFNFFKKTGVRVAALFEESRLRDCSVRRILLLADLLLCADLDRTQVNTHTQPMHYSRTVAASILQRDWTMMEGRGTRRYTAAYTTRRRRSRQHMGQRRRRRWIIHRASRIKALVSMSMRNNDQTNNDAAAVRIRCWPVPRRPSTSQVDSPVAPSSSRPHSK